MDFETFRRHGRGRHDYARDWKKRTGGKVVGTFCTYVPEEILAAGGVLPVRILGSHEPADDAEPYVFGMFCPFSRDCISQAIRGRYDYLDGTVLAQTCLHIRNTFWSWQKVNPGRFHYYMCFPIKVQSPRAVDYATGEMRAFRAAFEKWLGRPLADAQIRDAIRVCDENRALLEEIYGLRKDPHPPLTGREAMEMVLAGQLMDKREHNQLLRQALAALRTRRLERDPGVRLMIVGSEDDDTEFIGTTEELGCTIVVDEHCTGTRYFLNRTPDDPDPMRALARRYVGKPPCPSRDWDARTRTDRTLQLARDYNVQGALLVQQKFCDPHELDIPAIKSTLERNGIPTLFLEFDVTIPFGQFRTRIEAFLEMIRAEALF
ncbi:MAG: benzoyl-CoA reductase, bzd-type, subunit N [Planctomycetes bacterium]|nr:benzoyl-CoA reductase, bzd-type, subunit N [Planctomycetota bacterium]